MKSARVLFSALACMGFAAVATGAVMVMDGPDRVLPSTPDLPLLARLDVPALAGPAMPAGEEIPYGPGHAPATTETLPLSYACHYTATPPKIDGDLSDEVWESAPWTSDFVDIRGGDAPTPRYRTRVKMLWDDQALYVCAKISEPHVWATLTEKNSVIYQDNDFEIFIDPDGDALNYYEFEMNALGTIWELTLDKPYSKGGNPTLGTNLPGLKSAVKIQGTLNDPGDEDQGWTVEIAIPFADMARYLGRLATPLHPVNEWRINFSRVEWKSQVEDGKYVRIPPKGTEIPWTEHPEDNWVWSPQGAINMHIPEKWGVLKFER